MRRASRAALASASTALALALGCARTPPRSEAPPAEVTSGQSEVVEGAPDPARMPPGALLEEAASLEQRGDREGARALLDRVLARADLTPAERARALTEAGVMTLADGRIAGALSTLREAVATVERSRGAVPRGVAAHARFYLGEALAARAAARRLDVESGEEALATALEARARGLLDAREAYLGAGHEGDPQVAVAAGARTGDLYDGLRGELLTAPLPSRVTTPEARDLYREELRARLQGLARQAEEAWTSTLEEARARGIDSPWIARIEASLSRLRREAAAPRG